MKKVIYIGILAMVFFYCFNALTSEEEKPIKLSDYSIAEKHIMDFEPKKAIPYLERIKSTDIDYKKAQDLLQTIAYVYDEEIEPISVEQEKPKEAPLDDKQRKALVKYQRDWAKLQTTSDEHHKDYLVDFEWLDLSTVNFVLSKDASEYSSLQAHEETWIPSLSREYLDGLSKLNLSAQPIVIQFKRKLGVSNRQLVTSPNGWLPAEYLWYDVKLYFGHGEEKRYIGQILDGEESDGKKYVIIRTKSGNTERKTLDHIKSSAYFINADDPNVKTRILRFN